jgi:hypothetical protein
MTLVLTEQTFKHDASVMHFVVTKQRDELTEYNLRFVKYCIDPQKQLREYLYFVGVIFCVSILPTIITTALNSKPKPISLVPYGLSLWGVPILALVLS